MRGDFLAQAKMHAKSKRFMRCLTCLSPSMIPLPAPKDVAKSKKRASKSEADQMSSVVYVGHIPHGFFEEQMRGFFTQFGDVI